ncbi:hypothetical protein GGI20_002556 [Coemansia sp. BCRC 34301]|nr:hypothetical protein GGI20_002556 [Coemansia sp. BCRC 34301]
MAFSEVEALLDAPTLVSTLSGNHANFGTGEYYQILNLADSIYVAYADIFAEELDSAVWFKLDYNVEGGKLFRSVIEFGVGADKIGEDLEKALYRHIPAR